MIDMFVLFVCIVRMKQKRTPKQKGKSDVSTEQAHTETASHAEPSVVQTSECLQTVNVPTVCGPAPPDVVHHAAEGEPDRRQLREYSDSIRVLREKGFTFREIAEWLHGYGVEADHNAVYRVYLNTNHPGDVAALEHELEEEERDAQV